MPNIDRMKTEFNHIINIALRGINQVVWQKRSLGFFFLRAFFIYNYGV